MLGTLEEDPRVKPPVTPGFEGFDRIVDTDELDALLDADARTRVDSLSLLRARLLDLVVGDTDRHRDQWDWAHDTKTGRFVAVPSDRDLAFVKFDGFFLKFARQDYPAARRLRGSLPEDPVARLAGAARRPPLPLGPRVGGLAAGGRRRCRRA